MTGVAIDATSRIVIVGGFTRGQRSCVTARLLPDGSRDLTFGTNGVVRQDLGESGCWYNTVALQADGKIVAFGEIDGHTESRALLARYSTDGTLDPLFGDGGIVIFDHPPITSGLGVSIDSHQRIVVVGQTVENDLTENVTSAFFTKRYLPDGSIDASFGESGVAEVPFVNGRDSAWAVTIQDDRIVVAGTTGSGSSAAAAIVRYTEVGARDESLGSTGTVTVAFDTYAEITGIVQDSVGRLVSSGVTTNGNSESRSILMRLNPDGSLDSTFGEAGKVISQAGFSFSAVATSADAILAVGERISEHRSYVNLARYTLDGTLDASFGTGGRADDLPLSDSFQFGLDLAVQADARIVVGGGYGDIQFVDMLVARYCP